MTDNPNNTNHEPEDTDTYHDQETLTRISVNSNRMSWMFLILFLVVLFILVLFIWQFLTSKLTTLQFLIYFLTTLVPLFLGGFFWIGSQMLSEGIYLLMDIEDNTRRTYELMAKEKG